MNAAASHKSNKEKSNLISKSALPGPPLSAFSSAASAPSLTASAIIGKAKHSRNSSTSNEQPNPIDRYVSKSKYFSHVRRSFKYLSESGEAKFKLLEAAQSSNPDEPQSARLQSRRRMLAFALSVAPSISETAGSFAAKALPENRAQVKKLQLKSEVAVSIADRKLIVRSDRSKWKSTKTREQHELNELAVPLNSASPQSSSYHHNQTPESSKRKWDPFTQSSDQIAIATPELLTSTSLNSQAFCSMKMCKPDSEEPLEESPGQEARNSSIFQPNREQHFAEPKDASETSTRKLLLSPADNIFGS